LLLDKSGSQFSLGIVITDLDSSSDEDEDGVDTPFFSITGPLLERLSSRARELIDPQISPPNSSQALVLYRPLRRDLTTNDAKRDEGVIGITVGEVRGEDNVMDVETW